MTEEGAFGGVDTDGGGPSGAGISWEPGDEDYPFPTQVGESALDYFERWLEGATYARLERGGVRYIHETDVANVLINITADVGLLRARLRPFGDRVVTGADHAATVDHVERAIAHLNTALDALREPDG
jgi:hypothetical protein